MWSYKHIYITSLIINLLLIMETNNEEKGAEGLVEEEKKGYGTKYKVIFFFLFFFMGVINNLGYVLILTCSQQFSSKLDNPSLIALYPL